MDRASVTTITMEWAELTNNEPDDQLGVAAVYRFLKQQQYRNREHRTFTLLLRSVPNHAVFRLYCAMAALAVDWATVECGVEDALRPAQLVLMLEGHHAHTYRIVDLVLGPEGTRPSPSRRCVPWCS